MSKFITVTNNEQISRYSLIEWVNQTCNTQYENVEELFDAVAYCKMLHALDPNCISMKRVRLSPKFQHDYLNNWKAVQAAFMYLNVPNPVPAERLLAKGFQVNFEFLRWFRKFYMDEMSRERDRPEAKRGYKSHDDTDESSKSRSSSKHKSTAARHHHQQETAASAAAAGAGAGAGAGAAAEASNSPMHHGAGDLLTEYNMACSRLVAIEQYINNVREQPNQSAAVREICTNVLDIMRPIFCVADAETTMHDEGGNEQAVEDH